MIVTPEGLNVFPEDVERVVNAVPGVKDSAAVGVTQNGEERVQVALDRRAGHESRRTSSRRPTRSSPITSAFAPRTIWPGAELPRTEGTKKLKRHEIRAWLQTGARASGVGRRAARASNR